MRAFLGVGLSSVLALGACGETESSSGAGGAGPDAGVDSSVQGGTTSIGGGTGGTAGNGGSGGTGASSQGGNGGSAGQCIASSTCSAYCQHLVATSGCDFPGASAEDVEAYCNDDCAAQEGYVHPDCHALFASYVSCASCASFSCPGEYCDAGICVEYPLKVLGCGAEDTALQACAGACLDEPITEGGVDATGSYEYETSRCACPSTPRPGSAAGETCSGAGDCAQSCCSCPTGHGRYLVQRCELGTCSDAATACADALNDVFIAEFCAPPE